MNAKNFHAAVMAITEELPEVQQEAYWEALREVLVRIMDMYRLRRKKAPNAFLDVIVAQNPHNELYETLQSLKVPESFQEDINHLLKDTAWRIEIIPLTTKSKDKDFYQVIVYHP